jgi:hypothetical protein
VSCADFDPGVAGVDWQAFDDAFPPNGIAEKILA